jgi:hypothetical protein
MSRTLAVPTRAGTSGGACTSMCTGGSPRWPVNDVYMYRQMNVPYLGKILMNADDVRDET